MELTATSTDRTTSQELFRREAISAAKTQDFPRAQIARPWGVLAVAAISLPLLAALLAILTNYSYESTSVSKGFVRSAVESPCSSSVHQSLVGVLRVDEYRLSRLSEGTVIPLRAPAFSPQTLPAKVICIASAKAAMATGDTKAEFEVVVSLDSFRSLAAPKQPLRPGMTIQAPTQRFKLKLWKLFTKDDRDAR